MSQYGTPGNSMYQRGGYNVGSSTNNNDQYGTYPPQHSNNQGYPQSNNSQPEPKKVHSSVPGYSSPPASSFASSQQQEDNSKNKTPRRRISMDARVQTKQWVEKNYSNLVLYFGLIVLILIFYHAMSDGDFSFLLVS
jgi:hypothetical protein